MAAWNELPPTGGLPECDALVALAERLQWSAPELVMHYARRALALGGSSGGGPVVVRAQALLAAAYVRLGRHADAVEPALAALRGADQSGVPEFASSVRVDLAACSRGLGEPMLGCAILRPVLDAVGSRPATRAGAIGQLVGCTAHVGRRDDIEDLLAEADRLFSADDGLGADARRLERAMLAVRTAAYHRRYGETEDAVDAAREGLGLLARLRDPRLEGGRAWARLTWELVCALLDDGELADAEQEAGATLGQPVRAASAPAVGRLMLAVATRILVPAGQVASGRGLLEHATRIAERHGLDWLLTDALTATADLDERAAQPADALRALRTAHAAEYRHRRSSAAATRALMAEFGVGDQPRDAVNSLLRNVIRAPVTAAPPVKASVAAAPPLPVARPDPSPRPERADKPATPPETDEATGLLTREALSRRLEAARDDDRPVALTLVRLDPVDADARPATHTPDDCDGTPSATEPAECPPEALTTLAGRVRDIAPEDAELARSDGSELAVLLPHTTRDEAEEFAATIRESAIESHWLAETSISTGVAQTDPDPATDQDADSLLTAARETFTPADRDRTEPIPQAPTPDEPAAESGTQAIRDLLAPLLDHPTLAGPAPRFTIPTVPEPDDVPTPPREPDPVPPIPPGPEPIPEVPTPAQLPSPTDPEPDRDHGPTWIPKPDPAMESRWEPKLDQEPEPRPGWSPTSSGDASPTPDPAAESRGRESNSNREPQHDSGWHPEPVADAVSTPDPTGESRWKAKPGREPEPAPGWHPEPVADAMPTPDPAAESRGRESNSNREPQHDSGWHPEPVADALPTPDPTAESHWPPQREPSSYRQPESGPGWGAESVGDAVASSDRAGGSRWEAKSSPQSESGAGWGAEPGGDAMRAPDPAGASRWEATSDREPESGRGWKPESPVADPSLTPEPAAESRGQPHREPKPGREPEPGPGWAAEPRADSAPEPEPPRWTPESPADTSPEATPESRWEPKWPGEAPDRTPHRGPQQPWAPTDEQQPESQPRAAESHPPNDPEPEPPQPNTPAAEAEWPPQPAEAEAATADQEPAQPTGEHQLEAGLGPVEGPQPRPPDLPASSARTSRRRDRSDTTSIAELLAEALAAYQSTAPDDEPTQPRVEPVRENTPPSQRPQPGSGRHRMPDWTTSERDMTDWMTFDRDGR